MEDVRNDPVEDVETGRPTEQRDGDRANADRPEWDAAPGGSGVRMGDGPGPPDPEVGPRTYRARHDWNGPEPLGATVVDAVTRATGRSMFDVQRLSDVVDPDALESVFGPIGDDSAENAHVTFPLAGRRVTVYASGDVIVEAN